jgi:hypothetical protein
MLKQCTEIWELVDKKRPLVHCITNYVTVNDVANILLSAGASPAMIDHPEEAEGFAVAIAEPNVRILAAQIDFVSAGAIPTNLLIYCIALGVAFSVGLAMLRLVLRIPITRLLAVGFGLIFLLALVAPAQYFPVSFDAGGLTTGPLVIPFILSLGVGVASVLRGGDAAAEGFGMVGLVYIGPVLAVLLLGVIYG